MREVADIAERRRSHPPTREEIDQQEVEVVTRAMAFFRWFEEAPVPVTDLPAQGLILLDACEALADLYDRQRSGHPSSQ